MEGNRNRLSKRGDLGVVATRNKPQKRPATQDQPFVSAGRDLDNAALGLGRFKVLNKSRNVHIAGQSEKMAATENQRNRTRRRFVRHARRLHFLSEDEASERDAADNEPSARRRVEWDEAAVSAPPCSSLNGGQIHTFARPGSKGAPPLHFRAREFEGLGDHLGLALLERKREGIGGGQKSDCLVNFRHGDLYRLYRFGA